MRDVFRSRNEKVSLAALNLLHEQLDIPFISSTDVLAMLHSMSEQSRPRCDFVAFDFLSSASCDRNAGTHDGDHTTLRKVFLQFLDECIRIHTVQQSVRNGTPGYSEPRKRETLKIGFGFYTRLYPKLPASLASAAR